MRALIITLIICLWKELKARACGNVAVSPALCVVSCPLLTFEKPVSQHLAIRASPSLCQNHMRSSH